MTESFREHPSEEALERFLLNASPEDELEGLEMHVLACGQCVDHLEALEVQIAATRMVLRRLEFQRLSERSVENTRSWTRWFTIPRLSFAATGFAAAAGAILFSIPRDVNLAAYRGSETTIVSEGMPLHLHLNAAGLNSGAAVALELADKRGSVIWKGTSVVRHDTVDVTLPRITESGSHYLRLYAAPSDATDGVLVHEFALNAQWRF